jgi:hypothetical protein
MKVGGNALITAFLLMGFCFLASNAFGALGQSEASVKEDMRMFSNAQVSASPSTAPSTVSGTAQDQKFSIQEIDSQFTQVREFIDDSGQVFAVTWLGAHHPKLSQLFGKYFQSYKATLLQTAKKPGRAALTVKNDEIVVKMGGHMGGVHGFAYIPKLLPDGVSLQDLK